MVGGGGVEFGGEQGAVIGAELVGVQAQAEPERLRGAQDRTRLFHGKHVGFAEDIAVLGEVLFGNAGEHFVDYEIDVVSDAAAKFVGDFVGAEESGHVAQAGVCVELADGLEDFDFGIGREAVARLGFDGGGAAREEPVRVAAAGGEEGIAGGLAGLGDGSADAPAGCQSGPVASQVLVVRARDLRRRRRLRPGRHAGD